MSSGSEVASCSEATDHGGPPPLIRFPIPTRELGTNLAIVILRRSAHPPLRREAFDRALLR